MALYNAASMPRIGIFDSGVGGLTVQRAILGVLPNLAGGEHTARAATAPARRSG